MKPKPKNPILLSGDKDRTRWDEGYCKGWNNCLNEYDKHLSAEPVDMYCPVCSAKMLPPSNISKRHQCTKCNRIWYIFEDKVLEPDICPKCHFTRCICVKEPEEKKYHGDRICPECNSEIPYGISDEGHKEDYPTE